jgi:3-dehydroquinate synthase
MATRMLLYYVISTVLTSSSWSPLHELVPETPLRHGHAISIDMAYSATLANSRKLISDEEHKRILNLFSRAGLSMDHELFDEEILEKATQAILKTRDGKLRAAVPNPIGSCVFLNDVSSEELKEALARHKKIMADYPRKGEGLEAYVDASDTGYTDNNKKEEREMEKAAMEAGNLNESNGIKGGKPINGHNGTTGINGGNVLNGHSNADGVKEALVNGTKGLTNGTNGFTNGAKA